MIIPIPVGERRICTIQGSIPQSVCCEKCRLDYVYLSTRIARGTGTNPLFLAGQQADREAEQQARQRLAEAFEHAVDPVPCPGCGWFQQNMIAPARQLHWAKLRQIGKWMAILSLIVMFPFYMAHKVSPESVTASVLYRGLQATFVVGLLLFPLRRFLASRFEPNGLPVGQRLQVGRTFALTREAFLKLAAEAGKQESAGQIQ